MTPSTPILIAFPGGPIVCQVWCPHCATWLIHERHKWNKTAEQSKKRGAAIYRSLLGKVDEMEISVRLANCLKNAEIIYVGDLVQHDAQELLRISDLGRQTLAEVKDALDLMGLHLGMTILGWPPENIEHFSEED